MVKTKRLKKLEQEEHEERVKRLKEEMERYEELVEHECVVCGAPVKEPGICEKCVPEDIP